MAPTMGGPKTVATPFVNRTTPIQDVRASRPSKSTIMIDNKEANDATLSP